MNYNKSIKNKQPRKKTLKNKELKKTCIAVLFPDNNIKNNKVKGIVNFNQYENFLLIEYEIEN